MRVLCLHGKGSNNEIFKVQTAPLQAALDDFSFEFVEGNIPHTGRDGNWSIYTSPDKPLYSYFDNCFVTSILRAEEDLLQLIREEGPFDGVIAYCMGAMVAAQVIIRAARENARQVANEMPFRFAVFINGATPLYVFPLEDVAGRSKKAELAQIPAVLTYLAAEAGSARRSANANQSNGNGFAKIANHDASWDIMLFDNERPFVKDATHGVWTFDQAFDGALIDIPTLHVRCLADNEHLGLTLLKLCRKDTAHEYHHLHGHDFPRGHQEMKKIASLIRLVADLA